MSQKKDRISPEDPGMKAEDVPSTMTSEVDKELGSENEFFCRICMEDSEETSPLIMPCVCSGSLKYVHFHCLKEWIEESNETNCGVCNQPHQGLVMSEGRIPFKTYLRADLYATLSLYLIAFVSFFLSYMILVGFITSSLADSSDDVFSFFKFLLSYSNYIFLCILLLFDACLIGSVIKGYKTYCRDHKSYHVSGHEERISKEAIQRQVKVQVRQDNVDK